MTSTTYETAHARIQETLRLAAALTEAICRGMPITVNENGELGFSTAVVRDMTEAVRLAGTPESTAEQLAQLLDFRTFLLLQLAFSPASVTVAANTPAGKPN